MRSEDGASSDSRHDLREGAFSGSTVAGMLIEFRDFNNAEAYFAGNGSSEWSELQQVLDGLELHFQPSDQAGIQGTPIFDPKGTNAALTAGVQALGWAKVLVPEELTMFGTDWDAGKGATLAEWQFSNYPFLWNNVIRTQAVVSGQVALADVGTTEALVVVTKAGLFPASQSTLYYEQAEAQLEAVFKLGAFSLPVRLVKLTIDPEAQELDAVWSTYPGRYAREPLTREPAKMIVTWGMRRTQYGTLKASFERR
jgi:hypothetical protein